MRGQEESTPPKSLNVTVLGGFLGVGKTTLLNHLLRHAQGRRLGVIVNDFGSINVDADLVVGVEGDMVQLSNGCICCSIRDDLLEGVERLLALPEPPEHLIIEASGVSDPRRVAASFDLPSAPQWASIDAVVVVIDVEAYLEMGRRERIVAGGQIAAADILVLNKVDRVDEEALEALEARLRRSARRARLLRAEYGRVSPTLVLGVGTFEPERVLERKPMLVHVHEVGEREQEQEQEHGCEHEHKHGCEHEHRSEQEQAQKHGCKHEQAQEQEHGCKHEQAQAQEHGCEHEQAQAQKHGCKHEQEHGCRHEPEPEPDHMAEFWTWSFRTARPLSARRLRKAINGLPRSVVRAKGLVHLASHPDTRAVMHVVGKRAELCLDEPWGAHAPSTGLVFIGTGDPVSPDQLEPLFRSCEVEPGQGGPASAVMRWVRRVFPTREAS